MLVSSASVVLCSTTLHQVCIFAFNALTLLGGKKGIRPVKNEWWGVGLVIYLERCADLHTAQLMPLPLAVSCFSKSQIGFTFWYRPTWVVLDKGPLNGCMCVCALVVIITSSIKLPMLAYLCDYYYALMNRATLKNCHNHETSKNKDTTFKIQAGIDLGVWIKYFMYHVLICAYYSETRVLVKSNRNDTPYNSNYNSFQDCFTNKLHVSDCYSDKISNKTYDNKSQTAKANKMAWHHLQFQTFKWYHLANVSSLPFSHMDYFINHV